REIVAGEHVVAVGRDGALELRGRPGDVLGAQELHALLVEVDRLIARRGRRHVRRGGGGVQPAHDEILRRAEAGTRVRLHAGELHRDRAAVAPPVDALDRNVELFAEPRERDHLARARDPDLADALSHRPQRYGLAVRAGAPGPVGGGPFFYRRL